MRNNTSAQIRELGQFCVFLFLIPSFLGEFVLKSFHILCPAEAEACHKHCRSILSKVSQVLLPPQSCLSALRLGAVLCPFQLPRYSGVTGFSNVLLSLPQTTSATRCLRWRSLAMFWFFFETLVFFVPSRYISTSSRFSWALSDFFCCRTAFNKHGWWQCSGKFFHIFIHLTCHFSLVVFFSFSSFTS